MKDICVPSYYHIEFFLIPCSNLSSIVSRLANSERGKFNTIYISAQSLRVILIQDGFQGIAEFLERITKAQTKL